MTTPDAPRTPLLAAAAALALACAACASRPAGQPDSRTLTPVPPWGADTTPPACDSSVLARAGVPRARLAILQLRAPTPGRQLPRPYADSALARLLRTFRMPSPLALTVYSGPTALPGDTARGADTSWVHPDFRVALRLTMTREGRVRRAARVSSSHSEALDSAVAGAVDRALGGGEAPPLVPTARDLAGDSLAFDVELRLQPVYRGWYQADHAALLARGEVLEAPVTEVQVPHYRGARPLWARPGSHAPLYPRAMRERGVNGEVRLRGVVGTDGRLVPSSVAVVRASDPAFAEAVRASVPGYRLFPTRIGGCAVPTYLEQPYIFEVGRRS